MDAWASTYAGAASFVIVSCAGPQLAAEFGKQLRLKTCINTWVDEEDMPSWGQLGCNGFIVLDGARSVVCRQSPAYLEVREQAFKYVDTLLSSLVAQAPTPALASGTAVSISGLVSKPELNGLSGVCVASGANGRYEVRLQDGRSLSVKASNLTLQDGADAPGEFDGETGGCGGKAARAVGEAEGSAQREGCGDCGAKRTLDELTPLQVASVKNAALDEEHERCAAALERLARERSEEAARAVLQEYEAHFSHEEELLDRHLYTTVLREEAAGGGGGGFSADGGARRSHFNDHQRDTPQGSNAQET